MSLRDESKIADREKVITDLNESTHRLLKQFAAFDTSQFNIRHGDSWTAGEIAEHLLLLDILITKAINGSATAVTRKPDEKLPLIKSVFENVDRRLTSPEFIQPSDTLKDTDSMMQRIQMQRYAIAQAIQVKDLSELCNSFKHPSLGECTCLEWIYFSIYHTERHLKQLQYVLQKCALA